MMNDMISTMDFCMDDVMIWLVSHLFVCVCMLNRLSFSFMNKQSGVRIRALITVKSLILDTL